MYSWEKKKKKKVKAGQTISLISNENGNFMSHLFKFEIKFDTAMLGHFGIQTSKSASTNSHMVALLWACS